MALVLPPLVCLVAAAILFASTSGTAAPPAPGQAAAPAPATPGPAVPDSGDALLSDAYVLAHPENSPERVLMTWWQDMQFNDPALAYRNLSRRLRARIGAAEFAELASGAADGLRGIPRVVSVMRRTPATARVRLALRRPRMGPSIGRTIVMVRDPDGWRVDDLRYLQEVAAAGSDRAAGPTGAAGEW